MLLIFADESFLFSTYQLTFRFNRLLMLAGFFLVFSTVGGLYLSVTFDLPSGSTIVMLITIIFLISFIISPKRRLANINQLLTECKYCSEMIFEETRVDPGCLQLNTPHYHIPHDDHRKGVVIIDKRNLHDKAPSTHKHQDHFHKVNGNV